MFAIEAEGVGIPTKARDTGASAFIIGARGSLRLQHRARRRSRAGSSSRSCSRASASSTSRPTAAATAATPAIKKDTDFEFHGGVGAKYFLTDVVHLRLDARALGVPNTSTKSFSPDWEFMAGVGFTFGGHDAGAAAAARRR